MKLAISIDVIGWYLWGLVWKYNDREGVPARAPEEYLPDVPDMLLKLKKWNDGPYIYAGLIELVRRDGLTDALVETLCQLADMDIKRHELFPVLGFMLREIEEKLRPASVSEFDVEFVHTGHRQEVWRERRAALNPQVDWG